MVCRPHGADAGAGNANEETLMGQARVRWMAMATGVAAAARTHMLACVVMVVALALAAGGVKAQTPADLVGEMVGQWELSTAERSRTCVVTLMKDSVPKGLKLELEKGCADALPFTKDIVAWAVRGLDLVRFLDAQGQPVIDLSEVESGILEGIRTGEGVYILQQLAAARATTRSLDQMFGDWTIVRSAGRPICTLTLTSNESGKDGFAVQVKQRCGAPVANFQPVTWRLDRGELLLSSASGTVWRFEADDNAQWRRVPDTADPLLLVRP
jgi:hypothetical protein